MIAVSVSPATFSDTLPEPCYDRATSFWNDFYLCRPEPMATSCRCVSHRKRVSICVNCNLTDSRYFMSSRRCSAASSVEAILQLLRCTVGFDGDLCPMQGPYKHHNSGFRGVVTLSSTSWKYDPFTSAASREVIVPVFPCTSCVPSPGPGTAWIGTKVLGQVNCKLLRSTTAAALPWASGRLYVLSDMCIRAPCRVVTLQYGILLVN